MLLLTVTHPLCFLEGTIAPKEYKEIIVDTGDQRGRRQRNLTGRTTTVGADGKSIAINCEALLSKRYKLSTI